MSYIGNQPPDIGAYGVQSFDGGGTSFTLSKASTTATVLLFIDGVRQTPVDAYSVSGTTLTTTATTPSGTDNVTVQFLGDVVDFGEPSDDSVSTAKIQDDAVTAAKLANSINTEIAANTAKVTNATHTGDVTGATALTIANDAVDIPMLSATGTASATTFLRGDNSWQVVSDNTTQWQAVQTSAFTAVAGKGYPINTTSAEITVTLPATASAGDTIEFVDYAGTFSTNPVILDPQTLKLKGSTNDLNLTYQREGVRIVYVDATQGWVAVGGVNETSPAITSFSATGGTITNYSSGGVDYRVHTFTSSDNFVCTGSGTVDVMLVGGGGGGGTSGQGGGGGGGGMITMTSYSASGTNAIVIGAGAAHGDKVQGSSTTGFGETCTGGGGGGRAGSAYDSGGNGANGGGTGENNADAGGVGTAPSVVSGTATAFGGFNGGSGVSASNNTGAGGGGLTAVGTNAALYGPSGAGGAGKQYNLDNNNYYWGGGGAGGCYFDTNQTPSDGGVGGIGGGGGGSAGESGAVSGAGGGSAINAGGSPANVSSTGGAGGANSGGGGANNNSGGSGIVQVRYVV